MTSENQYLPYKFGKKERISFLILQSRIPESKNKFRVLYIFSFVGQIEKVFGQCQRVENNEIFLNILLASCMNICLYYIYLFLYILKTKHWFIIRFIFKSLERIYMFGVINHRLFNLQEHMQLFCQQLFVEILPIHLFVSVCVSELLKKVNVWYSCALNILSKNRSLSQTA